MPIRLRKVLLKSVEICLILLPTVGLRAGQAMLEDFHCDNASVVSIFKMMEIKTGVEFELKGGESFINGLPRLNMDFDRIPVTAMIRIICYEGNLAYKVSGKKISFTQYVPPKEETTSAPAAKKVSKPGGTRMTIGETSSYPVGWTTPRMVVQNGSVTTIHPKPIFRKMTSGVTFGYADDNGDDALAFKPTPATKKIEPKEKTPLPHDQKMLDVLAAIPVKDVRLQNVSLARAIGELREQCRDKASGLTPNIYLSCHVDTKANLTMTLDNMNLYDALGYVCRATGVKMLIMSWGVMIVPGRV